MQQKRGPRRKMISVDCRHLRRGDTDTYWKSTGRTTFPTMKSDDNCSGSGQWWTPFDRKASAVRPYLQDAGRPTASHWCWGWWRGNTTRTSCTEMDRRHSDVVGVGDGGRWKTTRTACTEMDRRHSDVIGVGMVEGERRPGRPVRRWIDDILMWCGHTFTKQCWWPWTKTTGGDSWLAPPVLADHRSEGGRGKICWNNWPTTDDHIIAGLITGGRS